jgi:hypothetical protein
MAKRKREEPVVRASVTISEQDCTRLQEIADALEVSLSWVVRRACTEFLERHQSESASDLRLVLYPKSTGGGSMNPQ